MSTSDAESGTRPIYKVYKRRFWGLAQLVLLNIVVSWDWLTFSSISTTAAEYFNVSESAINWMSTGYLFAFCAVSPLVIWILNKGGPKPAIVITASLLLVGNWLRYAGTRANGGIFGLAMFGQILIGFAQPFCLCAPTRYSDLWFSDRGRTSATAVASLANPLGAALGQLVDSEWATKPSDIPNMVLYISIISSVAAIPSFFLPASPPTPPSASSAIPHTPLGIATYQLITTWEFWQILIPFSVYVGFFNSVSSLLNQILSPYNFDETEAGIAGAILIVVGLVTAAIMSPITDRYKHYLGSIRVLVPIVAVTYIGLIFAPSSPAGIPPSYVVMALLGASSFALLPIVLEYLAEITYPFSPEIGSTICWTGGQLLGACFILIQDALKAGDDAKPPSNMRNSLIFAAVVAVVAAPFPLTIGLFGRVVERRRLEVDRGVELQEPVSVLDDRVKKVPSDGDTETLIKG
ncbi:Major facilitator superfamily domain general substrate transporter [Penicillium brevicompactum]|uniref:Major facilitator superfamily domain general substrate transporter n=1 Tax=Penicillium brevicompactum TaxID=5074 RepID=A0A9W9Q2P2_PENBR|nr:Major facilitator superfamily domain general substrate transporter [Penicillium brevicompactum]